MERMHGMSRIILFLSFLLQSLFPFSRGFTGRREKPGSPGAMRALRPRIKVLASQNPQNPIALRIQLRRAKLFLWLL